DRIKTERVQDFLEDLLSRLHSEKGELMRTIDSSGELSDEQERELGEAIAEMVDDFGPDFDAEGNPLAEGESERVIERARAGSEGGEPEGGEPEEPTKEREPEEVPA